MRHAQRRSRRISAADTVGAVASGRLLSGRGAAGRRPRRGGLRLHSQVGWPRTASVPRLLLRADAAASVRLRRLVPDLRRFVVHGSRSLRAVRTRNRGAALHVRTRPHRPLASSRRARALYVHGEHLVVVPDDQDVCAFDPAPFCSFVRRQPPARGGTRLTVVLERPPPGSCGRHASDVHRRSPPGLRNCGAFASVGSADWPPASRPASSSSGSSLGDFMFDNLGYHGVKTDNGLLGDFSTRDA